MTTRLRFLTWSADRKIFASLSGRLLDDKYREDEGRGFVIESARPNELSGYFLQRVVYSDEVLTEDGQLVSTDRIGLLKTRFLATPEPSGLILMDPPRKVSEFLMRISQHSKHSLSISPSFINLKQAKKLLERSFGRADIRSVRLSNVRIDAEASADVVVTDKTDALRKADEVFSAFPRLLSKLDMSFPSSSNGLRILVTQAGTVNIQRASEQQKIEAIASLRQTIA